MRGQESSNHVPNEGNAHAHLYLRRNLILEDFLGQIFATTCVTTSGFSRAAKLLTGTTFSCQRRVAHRLILLSGAYLVTGTQTRRAAFRTDLDAYHVAL